ncbi:DUF3253 domain-containing protein [Sneathiella glossodoripedis]|uniref:DUF3253 domain-containing protein n=1 Tax=Sneathiella glossodoripedis TaxID=418853 RepID=UPI000472BF2D|nr:DUF3253 domain-containing protein [Sneathiella glossodoripedis]
MSEKTKKEAPEDDPVAIYILEALEFGDEVSPNTIAQTIARDKAKETSPPDFWRKFMTAVRQQAIHLARNGRIEIVRKGQAVDPNDFKGLYKLRLPRK